MRPCMRCDHSKDVKGFFDDHDYTKFDAVLFNEQFLVTGDKPAKLEPSQIYIFNGLDSPVNTPACEPQQDRFFNWTLVYHLDADIVWSYFIVRNLEGAIIAPSSTVTWQKNLNPISPKIKTILAGKSAAAWLVSHCKTVSFREEYLTRLQEHLHHFALKIDVYGGCSQDTCTRDECKKMIEKDYFFYMAFENSFADDYVSEKVLLGYENYAVPIVYGAAN
ncbi:alpha-(1,3)-fucosyltransferase C-like [Bicyclus anynana]|uniref:Fucosyltransferase n=1 Tax=Bicyclus anynana TaxID=110368 RepID=A0ABM3LU93_BICAN|nr:alpha-(1,3)-fucosyltransferase C-like [Bicyclus anynana]